MQRFFSLRCRQRDLSGIQRNARSSSFCHPFQILLRIFVHLWYNAIMSNFKQRTLIYFAAVSAGALLLSNLAAIKLWDLFGIAVDGGVVVFPLTYIIGDLIVEFYGRRIARNVILASFLVNVIAVAVFYIVIALPVYPGWKLQSAYASVLGFTPRIICASLIAYLCSNFTNNYLFTRLRNGHSVFKNSFIARALGSSAFAHIIDSAIFETIAFLGVLPFSDFVAQAVFAYLLGIGFELILSPVEAWIAKKLRPRLCEYQNNNQFSFEITKRIPGKLGRAGIIHTPHGDIQTPAFMTVGTRGEVRYLSMKDLKSIQAQAMLSNGYHLRNISEKIADQGGLAKWSGWNGPTLTDSGGFQVMSLGSGCGKVVSMEKERNVTNAEKKDRLAHVSEDGVHFHDPFTDQDDFIGPKESMEIQCRIGADIHMAYDELTSLADSYEYNKEALARTERWAKRSLQVHKKHCDDLGYHQALYGVLQGGRWEDLRRSTARKLATMDFDGYGLGGAFLKESLGEILRWCCEELPEDKPRHLLGLSHPDDILIGTEMGADTFDCVAPTREARHGRIYTRHGNIAIKKFADSDELIEEGCDCPTCQAGWTRGQLRALLKSPDPKDREKYFNLASIHNLRFIIRLTEEARAAILDGTFDQYKENFLKDYYQKNA